VQALSNNFHPILKLIEDYYIKGLQPTTELYYVLFWRWIYCRLGITQPSGSESKPAGYILTIIQDWWTIFYHWYIIMKSPACGYNSASYYKQYAKQLLWIENEYNLWIRIVPYRYESYMKLCARLMVQLAIKKQMTLWVVICTYHRLTPRHDASFCTTLN